MPKKIDAIDQEIHRNTTDLQFLHRFALDNQQKKHNKGLAEDDYAIIEISEVCYNAILHQHDGLIGLQWS